MTETVSLTQDELVYLRETCNKYMEFVSKQPRREIYSKHLTTDRTVMVKLTAALNRFDDRLTSVEMLS